MRKIQKTARILADIFEVYIPITVFLMLFFAFLINVIFRYVVKNPQNWTFELSVNAFVIIGLLGACVAYRREDHVVFDLLYTRLDARGQNLLRIISSVIVVLFFSVAVYPSVRYLIRLRAVTPIMKIPMRFIFATFPILLISTILRSLRRLILDIRTLKDKTYNQKYNLEERDTLI